MHAGFFYMVNITPYLFLPICAIFSRKDACKKNVSLLEKWSMTHKQKKPFVYFNNELTEVVNSSFCISKNSKDIQKGYVVFT